MTIPPADSTGAATGESLLVPAQPLDGFAPEEFAARRAALRASCPDGLILIRGATESEAAHASAGTYRQNSSFYYLTGVETPGAFLVLLPPDVPAAAGLRDVPSAARDFLFLPARNPAMEIWTGAKLAPDQETARAVGIERVEDASKLWGALTAWLQRNPLVYTLMPWGEHAKLSREYALMQRITEAAPAAQFRDVGLTLSRQRMVKSPGEIERIRQAIAITGEGQQAARELIHAGAGRWEYEVEARVFEAFRRRGALLGFPSIIGSGIHSTVLHYEENRCQMQAGETVVVDIGARVGGYNGDVTRTYVVGGEFTPRQREIYNLVREAHERMITDFRLGEDTPLAIKNRCLAFLKDSPLRAKDTSGAEKTMDAFMPHGICHHLGLNVHDASDNEIPLAPGNVVTIEPGVYIPTERIGVRLEDDYLVTPNGLERLGPPLAK